METVVTYWVYDLTFLTGNEDATVYSVCETLTEARADMADTGLDVVLIKQTAVMDGEDMKSCTQDIIEYSNPE